MVTAICKPTWENFTQLLGLFFCWFIAYRRCSFDSHFTSHIEYRTRFYSELVCLYFSFYHGSCLMRERIFNHQSSIDCAFYIGIGTDHIALDKACSSYHQSTRGLYGTFYYSIYTEVRT